MVDWEQMSKKKKAPEMKVTKETGVHLGSKSFLDEPIYPRKIITPDPPPALQILMDLQPEQVKAAVDSAKTRFSGVIDQLDEMVQKAEKHQVEDEESYKRAINGVKGLKTLIKDIEKKRKGSIAGADSFVRGINSFCKMFKDRAQTGISNLNSKASSYMSRIELERRKREEEKRRQAKKLQEQADKEAAEAGVEPVEVTYAPEPEQKVTRTDEGAAAHTRKVWTYKVVDFGKLDDRYKEINDKVVKADIQAGVRKIEGLEVFQETKMVVR